MEPTNRKHTLSKVEHMNITVGNLDEAVKFLQTAMPDFAIRGEGDSEMNQSKYHWLHIGTDDSYVALQGHTGHQSSITKRYSDVGGNHVGFVVTEIDKLINRMESIGYTPSMNNQDHPHRHRVYFETTDGLEWEFIEYLSDRNQLNNDYAL